MFWFALLAGLFGFLGMGVWIALSLGGMAVIVSQVWGGGTRFLSDFVWSSLDIYSLTALPSFIFMGEVIERSGIAHRVFDSVAPLMARLPGKLLHTNVLVCAMFAAVFGSSTANAAAVGSVTIPELKKRGYDFRLSLGSVCVAGTLGMMIPPSGAFILYGSMTDASVGALFAAGMVPGVLMAIMFMVHIAVTGVRKPHIAPIEEKTLPLVATLRSLVGSWPLVLLMVACMAPIYAGWATATESAAVGALASIVVGSIFGRFGWRELKTSIIQAAEVSAMIFLLVLGAMLLAKSISAIGVGRSLILWVGSLSVPPVVVLAIIYVMYLILGCIIDGISMQLMTLPFVYPIILGLGFDPIWFGVVQVLLIEIGQVTPPFGLNLFVIQAIAGRDTSLSDIFIGSIPFLWYTLLMLAILTVAPGLVHWLPNLLHL